MPPEIDDKTNARGASVEPQPAVVDADKVRAEGVAAERKRVSEIQETVRAAKLGDDFAQKLIADGVSIDKARELVISQWSEKEKPGEEIRSHVAVGKDLGAEHRSRGAENALLNRANPGVKLDEHGADYRNLSLVELAREFVGYNESRRLSKSEIALRAMSTTDFSNVLVNVANKSLGNSYAKVTRTFVPFSRQTSLPDFKEVKRISLSEAPTLEKVVEGGEYKEGKFSDGAEGYKLFTYGKICRITRESIINDDLDAFTRIPGLMAAAAARLECDLVYSILKSNPKMSDGKELFHSGHGNLTNKKLSIIGIGECNRLLRVQKGKAGKDTMNLSGKFIIVPAALELALMQLMSEIRPTKADDVNPYLNKFVPIVESRLDADSLTSYYTVADPNEIDTIEYAYLDGQTTPYIESRNGFNTDGLEIKIRHDFAAKAIDSKGMIKSTGDAA